MNNVSALMNFPQQVSEFHFDFPPQEIANWLSLSQSKYIADFLTHIFLTRKTGL